MPAMSFSDIEKLWTDNGGDPSKASLFAAIAEAESGGDPTSLNNTPATGDYSVGLWQINYYDGLLQDRTNKYGPPAALQGNANAQAKAAIDLSNNGTNLQPWQGDPVANAALRGQPIPAQFTAGQSVASAAASSASAPGGGLGSAAPTTRDCSQPVIGEPGILGVGAVTLLNVCQAQEIGAVLLMAAGALVAAVGLGVLLVNFGVTKNPLVRSLANVASVGDISGRVSARRINRQRADQTAELRERRQANREGERAANRLGMAGPSAADQARWEREGFPGDQ